MNDVEIPRFANQLPEIMTFLNDLRKVSSSENIVKIELASNGYLTCQIMISKRFLTLI